MNLLNIRVVLHLGRAQTASAPVKRADSVHGKKTTLTTPLDRYGRSARCTVRKASAENKMQIIEM